MSQPGGVRRRWNRKEYYRAAALGLFRPEERLELLDGEILQKVTPQRPPHATAVSLAARALAPAFGPEHHVRQQQPLILDEQSEPEPDILVVPGAPDDYLDSHPTAADASLLVEVADTTLPLDRGGKLAAYARAEVREYWILNLRARLLEVHRDPSGEQYLNVVTYAEGEFVVPLGAPQTQIQVADLLPASRISKRR